MATRAAAAALAVPLACIIDEGSMDAVVSEACRRARLPTAGCGWSPVSTTAVTAAMGRLMAHNNGALVSLFCES